MLVRRYLVGGAAAAALLLSGCGGDSGDGTAAAPASSAAPTAAATTGAVPPADGSAPAGSPVEASCTGIATAATAAITKVAEAGFDYDKAGTELSSGAATIRAALPKLTQPAAKAAAEELATAMDTAAAAARNIDTSNPAPYVDAQKKVGDALVKLGQACL